MADNHVCFTIIHILQKKKSKKPKVFECTSITPPKITLSLSQEEESAKQRSTEATTHTHTHTKSSREAERDVIRENDAEAGWTGSERMATTTHTTGTRASWGKNK